LVDFESVIFEEEPIMSYVWKDNYACSTVFAVMRSDRMLDQHTIPKSFKDAGSTKLGKLTYFPRTSNESTLIDNQATMVANMFVNYMDNLGVFSGLEEDGKTLRDVKDVLKNVFKDADKTLLDVAEILDGMIKFFDE
jgi:hypothetical protein